LDITEERYLKITWQSAGAAVAAVVTVVLWLATVDSKASDALQRLDRQKDSLHEIRADITAIRSDISEAKVRDIRMETILNQLNDRSKRF
jgi:hypothetical protein